jgi:dihydrofolate reductase
MRTVTYGGACSLDGFFTARDGALDWLLFSKDVEQFMRDFWQANDTLLFGRKTWEAAAGQGGGGGSSKMKSYVFSRTLTSIKQKGVELVTTDAGEFVRKLKAESGKGICVMSGGNLAGSLLEAGVIDEVGLNIHPILLGSGAPAFVDPGKRVTLELKECRTIDGGCVLVTYKVKPVEERKTKKEGRRR